MLCSASEEHQDYPKIYLITIYMSLLTIFLVLIVAGVLLWLVNNYIPMDGKIRRILNLVVVIAVIVWLIKVFGLLSYLRNIHI
jgi:hypothetical protein